MCSSEEQRRWDHLVSTSRIIPAREVYDSDREWRYRNRQEGKRAAMDDAKKPYAYIEIECGKQITDDRHEPIYRIVVVDSNGNTLGRSSRLYSLEDTRNGTCEVWAKNNYGGDVRYFSG